MATEQATIETTPGTERVSAGNLETHCCHARTDVPRSGVGALIAATVIGGQSMVWGVAINLTAPAVYSSAYWVLHGLLIASALVVAGILGRPLVYAFAETVRERRIGIEALFVLTASGAMAASLIATITGQGSVYYEVVAVVLAIYGLGKFIGQRTREQMLEEVGKVEADFSQCFVMTCCGSRVEKAVAELSPGDRVHVRAGEPITVEGAVREGRGAVRTSLLTGERDWLDVEPGARLRAGSWLVSGEVYLEPDPEQRGRVLDAVFEALREARQHPSRLQAISDRLAQYFVPFVVGVAAATAGFWVWAADWVTALIYSMSVLLVACPCAIGLATPIAVWRGLLGLAEIGIVSRDARLIDGLGTTRKLFWDKTGTLTDEEDISVGWEPVGEEGARGGDLIRWLVSLESQVDHPVARALVQHFGQPADPVSFERVSLIRGGVTGWLDDAGRERQLEIVDARYSALENDTGRPTAAGKRIQVRLDGETVGWVTLGEQFRADAEAVVEQLRELGVESEVLTGDPDPRLDFDRLGIQVNAGLDPMQKAERVEASAAADERPMLIGDGMNDTPAMHAAVASLAVAQGTSLARVVASGVIAENRLEVLLQGIVLAREILARLRGNIQFSVAYNLIGMSLAATGHLHPVAAALLMLGSSLWVSWRAAR